MAGHPKRLVLHFDVNETIMVGDPVSSVDFDASLNHVLAKVAFLNEQLDAWHDGSPLDLEQRKLKDLKAPPLLTNFDAELKGRKCYEVRKPCSQTDVIIILSLCYPCSILFFCEFTTGRI